MEKELSSIRRTVESMHQLMETLVARQGKNYQCCRAVTLPDPALLPQKEEEPTEPVPEILFNRKEAADFLLVDPRTVTRYRISGKLRFVLNDDGQIRYRREDLHACYFWKWGKKP